MFYFEIPGNPIPQKQTRRTKSGIFYNPSSKDEKRIKAIVAPDAPESPILDAIHLDISFYFDIPKSTPNYKITLMATGNIPHTKKPDIDNCAYLITNSLKKLVYLDDSQIIKLTLFKTYSLEPKTIIRVIPLTTMKETQCDSY
jgi:Holliday junction resolvase RusA-like endonuclease